MSGYFTNRRASSRIVVKATTRDDIKRLARQRGMTMREFVDTKLLADLPPTPTEVELRRLAADPAFEAGPSPRGGRRSQ